MDDLDSIWVRLLGQSQLSNPSDLPNCFFNAHQALISNEPPDISISRPDSKPGPRYLNIMPKVECDPLFWWLRLVMPLWVTIVMIMLLMLICVTILITQVTGAYIQYYAENSGQCSGNSGASVAKARFYDIHSVAISSIACNWTCKL